MVRFKCALVVGVAVFGVASVASAADMRTMADPVAAYNWTGSYVGVSAGWSRGSTSTSHSIITPNCAPCTVGPIQSAAVSSISPNLNSNNLTGGVQAGYNWQFNRFVIGLESDINYVNLGKSATSVVSFIAPGGGGATKTITSADSVSSSWVATLRPRIGFVPTERSLIYVTGGVAVTDLKASNATTIFSTGFPGTTGIYNSSASKVLGSVIGGGFEYAWLKNLTMKIEYQHLQFSNISPSGSNTSALNTTDLTGSTINTTMKVKADIVRAGVNWRY